jgi:heterodisulfide reductase subunit A-like polyferredoxin
VRELHCATCQAEMPFESLPYEDEFDDELICTRCGTAMVIAPVRAWLRPTDAASIAPHQRRAA